MRQHGGGHVGPAAAGARAQPRSSAPTVALLPLLFDAHCHLQLPHANLGSADELVARARRAGVGGAAVCSTSGRDWALVAALKARHPEFVRAQYGVHPWWLDHDDAREPFGWSAELRAVLARDPTAGVGETGLDKTRRSRASLAAQRLVCAEHLRIARDLRRPVTLHCVRAYGSLLELIGDFARYECDASRPLPTCVLHGFRGPADLVARFAALGCRFSFGGHPLDDAHLQLLRAVPRNRLLLETDAPDQLPPARVLALCGTAAGTGVDLPAADVVGAPSDDAGFANEPANLRAIVRFVAAELGWDAAELARDASANARAVFCAQAAAHCANAGDL
ncbi:hypothetical protein KFE25_000595 [Diacronema lutheri]|uniref:Uncharacterized protein n=1 Tax=Diacronema lutheri TaxID=2081491 RepID=A0A8J5XNZ9_DIALT|nr:hypothetical protein KFE25_000595 [Diacronema lutheri]